MSQNTSSSKQPANMKELWQAIAKPVFFILFLIMICAFLAHYLLGSETLEDYANNNPERAYTNRTESESIDNTAGPEYMDNSTNIDDAETPDKSSAYNIPEDDADDVSEKKPEDSMQAAHESSVNENDQIKGTTEMTNIPENSEISQNAERFTYQSGFYYEPLSDSIKQRITGISYPETGCTVPYENLAYVGLLYIDFDGEEQTGELICNKAIAQDMVEIFYELYRNDYRIERIRLVDEYDGDDTLSMLDNNTSCFNYRVVDGTTTLSKHALGCAIDINPFYNPYIVYNKNGSGETYISPKGSEIYADRSQDFPYKIDENDLCYRLFTEHGFTWGGNWNSTKDYQHFQIVLP